MQKEGSYKKGDHSNEGHAKGELCQKERRRFLMAAPLFLNVLIHALPRFLLPLAGRKSRAAFMRLLWIINFLIGADTPKTSVILDLAQHDVNFFFHDLFPIISQFDKVPEQQRLPAQHLKARAID